MKQKWRWYYFCRKWFQGCKSLFAFFNLFAAVHKLKSGSPKRKHWFCVSVSFWKFCYHYLIGKTLVKICIYNCNCKIPPLNCWGIKSLQKHKNTSDSPEFKTKIEQEKLIIRLESCFFSFIEIWMKKLKCTFFAWSCISALRFFIHTSMKQTRGPLARTLTWMFSYEGYIQPKYCKCWMQENLTFFAMAINQIQQFRLNSYGC